MASSEHVDVEARSVERVEFPDFVPSPNQLAIEQYEIENEAFDRRGLVLEAMRHLAPWAGHRQRIVRLLYTAGVSAPRRGPRAVNPDIRRL